jgi:hypothetical protein
LLYFYSLVDKLLNIPAKSDAVREFFRRASAEQSEFPTTLQAEGKVV